MTDAEKQNELNRRRKEWPGRTPGEIATAEEMTQSAVTGYARAKGITGLVYQRTPAHARPRPAGPNFSIKLKSSEPPSVLSFCLAHKLGALETIAISALIQKKERGKKAVFEAIEALEYLMQQDYGNGSLQGGAPAARVAHNHSEAGSIPAPATPSGEEGE